MRILNPLHVPMVLALAAFGCGTPRSLYDVDPAFQAHAYASMAPDPRKDRILIREGMRPLNPDLHLQAVCAQLEARNYRPAPAAEADLWVAVFVLAGGGPEGGGDRGAKGSHRPGGREGHREGHRGGRRGGGEGRGGAGPDTDEGLRGASTVIVQVQDRKSGQTVWQGEAHQNHQETGPDGRPLGIEATVRQLLRPFPARP